MSPDPTLFRPSIEVMLARVKGVDYRNFETLSEDRAWQEVVARVSLPTVCRLVRDARQLVESILVASVGAHEDQPELEFEPDTRECPAASGALSFDFDAGDLDRVAATPSALPAIEDVAFFVQMELRQRDERLARIQPSSDPLSIIGECDGALRRIRRGLGAIALALSRAEAGAGAPPIAATPDASNELEESLRARVAYARFRARLLALAEPGEATLDVRLRAASGQISVLVGGRLARTLRVRDRLQLLDLQRRILAWTATPAHADEIAGTRLWQDILAFVEMLARVNRRQELVEHDARVVGELLARLRGDGWATDGEARRLLRALAGLDDELDRLIAGDVVPPARALRPVIERLARQLGVTPDGRA